MAEGLKDSGSGKNKKSVYRLQEYDYKTGKIDASRGEMKNNRDLRHLSETAKRMATCIYTISISGDLVGARSKARENSSRKEMESSE